MGQITIRPLRASVALLCGATVVFSAGVAASPLEELVVTAQKREQALLEVPFSVSGYSGDALINAGVKRIVFSNWYAQNDFIPYVSARLGIDYHQLDLSDGEGISET